MREGDEQKDERTTQRKSEKREVKIE